MTPVLDVLEAVVRSPGRSTDEMRAYQTKCLADLVAHAYRNVPFYRATWERHGTGPEDVHGLDDLRKLPVVSRRAFQEADPAQLIEAGYRSDDLDSFRTSGSSGAPLTIRRTWSERKLLQLFRIRALRSYDVSLTDVVVRIGLPREPSVLTRFLHRLGAGCYRYHELDARSDPGELAALVGELEPDVVTGYTGALTRVAEAMDGRGRGGDRPRFVLAGGEVLTDLSRRHIRTGFGAPVLEWYGCFECNLVAWECRSTGLLHICDDSVVVEILRADGRPAEPGEKGDVAITPLHLRAMPFVRYRLGDVAVRGPTPCPCGAPFGTIREIQGRSLDYFRLPGDRLVHPYEVTNSHIKDRPWVLQYQLIQESLTRFRLRVVPLDPPDPSDVEEVRRDVTAALGSQADLAVELVDEIPRESSGKYRTAVCRLNEDGGRGAEAP